jgi:hypothetical protein
MPFGCQYPGSWGSSAGISFRLPQRPVGLPGTQCLYLGSVFLAEDSTAIIGNEIAEEPAVAESVELMHFSIDFCYSLFQQIRWSRSNDSFQMR